VARAASAAPVRWYLPIPASTSPSSISWRRRWQQGRIISTSSINALSGGVTSAVSKHAYAAAKAGILGLTRSLAKELGPKVSVNAICPGVVATDLLRGLLGEREAQLTAGIALGRSVRLRTSPASCAIWPSRRICS
jgi:NAD(P)-dependent dehydrogenase (short-subunit alcohol dehydrogenase family)